MPRISPHVNVSINNQSGGQVNLIGSLRNFMGPVRDLFIGSRAVSRQGFAPLGFMQRFIQPIMPFMPPWFNRMINPMMGNPMMGNPGINPAMNPAAFVGLMANPIGGPIAGFGGVPGIAPELLPPARPRQEIAFNDIKPENVLAAIRAGNQPAFPVIGDRDSLTGAFHALNRLPLPRGGADPVWFAGLNNQEKRRMCQFLINLSNSILDGREEVFIFEKGPINRRPAIIETRTALQAILGRIPRE